MKPLLICAWILFLTNYWTKAEATDSVVTEICGHVVDVGSGEGLGGATIAVLGTVVGGVADEQGFFCFGAPAGTFDLIVTAMGYRSRRLSRVDPESFLLVELVAVALEVPSMVVSATRRTQTFAESPISVAVTGPREIGAHNSFSLDAPLTRLSGVSKIGSQVSVRGSSGYSRGTGSRVLLLLDGFPVLSADLGDIKWDIIPTTEVARVEVVKGAGSALYGNGALGGVVNVVTRRPSSVPTTRFRLLSGLYSQPAYASWRWSEGPMYFGGVDVSHSRTLGRTGFLLSAGHKQSTGYYENGDSHRYHLFGKVERSISARTQLKALFSWAIDEHGVFVQWEDRNQPLAVAEGDRSASSGSWKLHVSSELYHLKRADLGYRLRAFFFRTGFENSVAAGNLTSKGLRVGMEMQTDIIDWAGLDLTLGAAVIGDLVESPGDFLGQRDVVNGGVYAHGVYRLGRSSDLSLGLRYDLHRRAGGLAGTGLDVCTAAATGSRLEPRFSPQVGLSFRPRPGTALRASVGRGFRAPSVTELYAQADVSGILVCPNPAVVAERSVSWEVGMNQVSGDVLVADAALFWNVYDGLVEGRPDPVLGGVTPVASFRNISRARIRGMEAEVRLSLPYDMRQRLAYTYLEATEFLAEDEILPLFCKDTLIPGHEASLPYRAKHHVNLDLTVVRREARAGIAFRFLSRFQRVSGLFEECRRDHIPIYLVDIHIGQNFGMVDLNLRLDNVFQYHYVLTERKIRPPRQVSLALNGIF